MRVYICLKVRTGWRGRHKGALRWICRCDVWQVVCVERWAGAEGCLGIYRVTHLMRREGRDGTAPHRERCSQNNDSILAKTQPAPAKHSKYVRSQQRRPKHPKFSRQRTELLPLGATSCIYIQAQTKARKAMEGWNFFFPTFWKSFFHLKKMFTTSMMKNIIS